MVRTICLAALALVMLAGCAAETPSRRTAAPAPPAGPSAPVSQGSPAGVVLPSVPPPPAAQGPARTADPAIRETCIAQCERSYRVCMDSASMGTEGSMGMLTEQRLFGPADDCQHQLRQCMPRCSAVR